MKREPVQPAEPGSVEAVVAGITDWQTAHPQASFAEIEAVVEERLNELRGKLLEAALLRRAAQEAAEPGEAWTCTGCGRALQRRGMATRTVTVRGDRAVPLRRAYGTCPTCGVGLFPPR